MNNILKTRKIVKKGNAVAGLLVVMMLFAERLEQDFPI